MPDRITETLTALRADVDTVGLADSGAVRRRGNQRTRHQLAGSALAVVALLAGVIGVSGQLTGDNRSIEGPPATKGPSVTAAPETPLTLAEDPLLRPDDIGAVGPHTGWKRSPEAVSQSLRPLRCVASPTTWEAGRAEGAQYYQNL